MKEGDIWEKMYLKEEYNAEEIEEQRTQRGFSVFKHIENASRRNSKFNMLRTSGLSNGYDPPVNNRLLSPPRSPPNPRNSAPLHLHRENRSSSQQMKTGIVNASSR